ncbi:SIR2 family NAD-dependent protein deacylase [Parafrankia sp. FMc2]|uniref:SIR2 family NAD-dependent protein deacylase n=1 Tax=Parafrankia sp. FMc2 TaxID=3233196 RepID=UPI0034D55C7E
MNEKDWERLVDQLKNGDCTPLVGPGAVGNGRPAGSGLSEAWATSAEYPFTDQDDLPRVMQYADVTEQQPESVRQRVAGAVQARPAPDFAAPTEPHALLARLPLPVYLTTNPDGFMGAALRHAGKRPRRAVCPWYEGAPVGRAGGIPEAFPNPEEPVVYHLHGTVEEPRSLVLTEDDHLDFVMNLAMDRGADDQQIIPTHILPALATRPMLFLGYSLHDWTFRLLFHGLLRTVAAVQPRRRASIQLALTAADYRGDRRRAEEYIAAYFGRWNVAVFWGSTADFCAELADQLGWS